jgi:hypothetical protein
MPSPDTQSNLCSTRNTPARSQLLKPTQLQLDPELQPRCELDESIVEEYAQVFREALVDGQVKAKFPPIEVFEDSEGTSWVADGWHRVHAARRVKFPSVECRVHRGTRRDALFASLGANTTHGLRPSNADKRRAVTAMLADGQWAMWTDRAIAKHCGVSPTFVGNMRKECSLGNTGRVGENVNVYTPESRNGESFADSSRANVRTCTPDGGNHRLIDSSGRDIFEKPAPTAEELEQAPASMQEAIVKVEEARAAQTAKILAMTDEEWLATLPARAQLPEETRESFDRNALADRSLEAPLSAFKAAVRDQFPKGVKGGQGAVFSRLALLAKLLPPDRWSVCAKDEISRRGCNGTGREPSIGRCPRCKGWGYLV